MHEGKDLKFRSDVHLILKNNRIATYSKDMQ